MTSRVTRDHHTWTRDTIKNVSGDVTLDLVGDLTIDVAGGQVTIVDDGSADPDLILKSTTGGPTTGSLIFKHEGGSQANNDQVLSILAQGEDNGNNLHNYSQIKTLATNVADGSERGSIAISVSAENLIPTQGLLLESPSSARVDATIGNGAASLTTIAGDLDIDGDTITSAGALEIDPGGALSITGQDVKIDATKKLYLDGGSDTYIYENTSDAMSFVVGGDFLLTLNEYGTDGNEVSFKTSCATFTRQEATFSVTGIIGSGGSDDTDIDFRFTNKYRLEMTADIHTMNLIFPKGSANFTLVCTANGDHDVSNWKVFTNDESAATTTDVMWAGGSVPAFTNNSIDIVSFYWDATEQQCYGVASLAFATP